jgi:hypothetical protein
MTIDKLNIKNEMSMFDRKRRDFYDSLTDEEKKKFSPFLMIRYGAAVDPNRRLDAEENYFLQAYYVSSTNERLNKHFFDISASQHKKLQWLLATTVSPDMGDQFHPWMALKKRGAGDNKTIKFLRELFPHCKEDELKLLSTINGKDDFKRLAKEHGWTDKQIKEYF